MNYSMQWHLNDEIPIKIGKTKWEHVAQFQPSLWRKGNQSFDLSFLEPQPYHFVLADLRYDTALLKEAIAKIILYLKDAGVKPNALTVSVPTKSDIKADEYRQLLGSWVYGKLAVSDKETGKPRLLITQVGANPVIDHDKAIYIVPAGNGSIYSMTDNRKLAYEQYDAQCGCDIPLSDLVIAHDSAMKEVAQFGSKERTERLVQKLKQLLKPDGRAILLADGALYGLYDNVYVIQESGYFDALLEIEKERDESFKQVVLISDLAYTKIRNVFY